MTIRTLGLVMGIFLAYNPLFGAEKEKPKPIFDIDTSVVKASAEDPHSTFVTQATFATQVILHDSAVPHYYIKEEYGPIARILTMTPAEEPLMTFAYEPKEGSHIYVSYYPRTKEYSSNLTAKKAKEKYAELEKMFNAAKAKQKPSELNESIPKTKEILQKLKAQEAAVANLEKDFKELLVDNPQLKEILERLPDAKHNFLQGILS